MSVVDQSTVRFKAAAYRKWPNADVRGSGPFAVVTYCGSVAIVWLHRDEVGAQETFAAIQANGCDVECVHAHKIVHL